MIDQVIEVLQYTIPSLITGTIAYFFFLNQSKNEDNKRNFILLKEDKKVTIPLRLQAYERMTLFMERINPSKLLVRVTPTDDDQNLYVHKLLPSIEQEFEHNTAQQIYMSENCWSIIIRSKNATTRIIKKTAEDASISSSQELREGILQRMIDSAPPSTTALSYIKDEVDDLF